MSRTSRFPSGLVAGVGVILVLATWDEGGTAPRGLLLWHTGLVVLLLAGWLLRRPSAGGYGIATAPLTAFALYAVTSLVGAFRAPYGYAAWLFVLELGAFLAVAWLAARCGPTLPRRLSLPMMLVGSGEALLLLVQKYVLHLARPAGTFLNPNHLAGWLVALLLVVWGGAVADRSRPGRRWSLLGALSLPILLAVAVTGSRGALLGLVAGLATLMVLVGHRIAPRWRLRFLGVAATLVLIVGAGLAARLQSSDPFRHQRLRIWAASLRMVVDQPWLGSGPRQFDAAARMLQFPDGDGPLRYDRRFSRPHSDLLRVPCELGLAGLSALALLGAAGYRHVRARRRDGNLSPAAVGSVAGLVALGAQALVENLSETAAVTVLVASLGGSLLAERNDAASALRWPARAALTSAILLVFVVGDLAPYLAWARVSGLSRERRDDAAVARLEAALALNPIHPDYWRRRAEQLAGDGSDWDLRTYAAARESAEQAIRLHPRGAEYRLALARLEGLALRTLFVGDEATRERAARFFQAAERLEPFNASMRLERAGLLLDGGDAPGAIAAAREALELEPEAVSPRLVLAGALLVAGGPGARQRAGELLAEAQVRAERWRDWPDRSHYVRQLLRPDPVLYQRVRQALR